MPCGPGGNERRDPGVALGVRVTPVAGLGEELPLRIAHERRVQVEERHSQLLRHCRIALRVLGLTAIVEPILRRAGEAGAGMVLSRAWEEDSATG